MSARPPFALLSVVSNIERHNIGSKEPFLLLMDLAWPGDAPQADQQHVRFVRDLDPITFDAADGLGPQVYTPFNFTIGDLKIATDGSVPETEIQASNVMRALQSVVDQYAGGVGANLDLYVVNPKNPAGEPELASSFQVKSTTSDAKIVRLKLGVSSPLRRLFPILVYRPNYCGWRYKSPQCHYTGPLPTCSFTLDGPNGCMAHFPDALYYPALLFPGIDTNGAAVASVV